MINDMRKVNENYHLCIKQALEIEGILTDWKRTVPVKDIVKRQAKLLDLLKELDKQ